MTISTTPKTKLRQVWEQIMHATSRFSAKLAGEQISRLSWARMVYTFEALPDEFQPIASDLIPDKQTFPYAVLTPAFEGSLKRENEKLVFCLDHRLYILENEPTKGNRHQLQD